ncbi:MAG: caspase family protein, partial [Verrucomicrobiota bacterium]
MNRLLHTTALVFLAYSGFAAASEQRVALVIGNGAYEHGNPLKNPAADAEDVSAALKQCGFSLVGGEAQLDLSHEAFEKAVVDFREAASEAEVALFFFAGHGLEVGGTNYLVPTDSKVEEEYQVKHRTVSLDEIMGAMAGNKDRLKIIILDCCRDNPLGRGWSRSGSQGLSAVTDTPDGTVILFSAGPGRVAADGQGRNSPFSAVLKEEILSPGT